MKSILITLGLAAAILAPAAHSSTLPTALSSQHFSSVDGTSVQASARKGKVQKNSKHAKAKRSGKKA